MKLFSLERLTGPGDARWENFEILCHALLSEAFGSCERLKPPDGGIDILGEGKDGAIIAYQCKAYPDYTTKLVSAVRESFVRAVDSRDVVPWERYYLVIPFVPTSLQRTRLGQALTVSEATGRILNSDDIELWLAANPALTRRFLPTPLDPALAGIIEMFEANAGRLRRDVLREIDEMEGSNHASCKKLWEEVLSLHREHIDALRQAKLIQAHQVLKQVQDAIYRLQCHLAALGVRRPGGDYAMLSRRMMVAPRMCLYLFGGTPRTRTCHTPEDLMDRVIYASVETPRDVRALYERVYGESRRS